MKFLAAVSRQRSALPVNRLLLRTTLIVSRVSRARVRLYCSSMCGPPSCLAKGDSDIRERRAVIFTSESGNVGRDVDWVERRRLNRT
jgi:hypothetical protein